MTFIDELKRRNVFRSILTYAVAGWLLVEVMALVTGTFEAPPWVLKVFISVVVLGFVPVVVFSWAYEITPEGIKRGAGELPDHTAGTARKLDIAVLVMLTVAIGLFVYDRVSREAPETLPLADATETAAVPATSGLPMVAVLPFATTSLQGDSEFFASGVHEDLLTQLAQLQSIRVISRTSVLEYRDTARNIREIGNALGADVILEGRVQSAGERIRINAQLIDARTDEHLWAQSYDRELSPANIFDVQTEIARAIASALQITLTEQDARQLSVLPTDNMAAYRAYHRAMEIRDTGVVDYVTAFREALETAVSLDPGFTRAWAELAGLYSYSNFVEEDPELIERAEQVLQRIQAVAPESAYFLIAQAYYTYYILKDNNRAHQLITQAQGMLPSDARVAQLRSWIERRQGDLESSAESIRLARTLDPRNPSWTSELAETLIMSHRYDEAMDEIESSDFYYYPLSYWHSVLELPEHRDFMRWAKTLAAIQQEFEAAADPFELWEAYIAAQDYSAAEKLLAAIQERQVSGTRGAARASMKRAVEDITAWHMRQDGRLAGQPAAARQGQNPDGDARNSGMILDAAIVAAVAGDTEETERLVRRWRRAANLTELAAGRHVTCRALGMAGATAAAVECIREGLVEPSLVMPFMEPFLPYYESMRNEPDFADLVAEIDDAVKNSS